MSILSSAPHFPAIKEMSFDSASNVRGTESSESPNKELDGHSLNQNTQSKRKNALTNGFVIKINELETSNEESKLHRRKSAH